MAVYVSIDHSAALAGHGPWVQAPPLVQTTLPAPGTHTATLILLHGFANSGAAWVPVAKSLQTSLPHIKFLLPNAPVRTVHVPVDGAPGEAQLPAWYDAHLSAGLPTSWPGTKPAVDRAGLAEARAAVETLIADEARLVGRGRVFLGGFSQGGIVSLAVGLENDSVGGIIALSCWLPLADAGTSPDAPAAPALQKAVFWAHGTADYLPVDFARQSVDALAALGFNKIEKNDPPATGTVTFSLYDGLKHATNEQELEDIRKWLSLVAA